MNSFNKTKLKNGINFITKKNINTPRFSINLFFSTGINKEKKAGLASLTNKLLLQGTKKYSAEDIAELLDSNAIEIAISTKQDYTKIKLVGLNEDLDKSIDILSEILFNSTFELLEKERNKFIGEINVELDSPRVQASDNLVKNLYPNHPYGHTHTLTLESLPTITKEEIKEYYKEVLSSENITFSVAGDINFDNLQKSLEENFANLKPQKHPEGIKLDRNIKENKIVTIKKDDVAQAQIIKAWILPGITEKEAPAISILNTILGASGLSSRLFTELRDKQGLAYVVRSNYDSLKQAGTFTTYIATAPQNIETAIKGFNTEIEKLQNTTVSEEELENAKNNYLGKRAFFHETNSQKAHYLGYYETIGLGAEYDKNIEEKIKEITPNEIMQAAKKYLAKNAITSILAPTEHINKIK